jgi:CPA2 family monovalent cation:H+ antiporter-2
LFIAGGRLLLRPLFRLVASAGSTELFMAACLLVIVGSGVASAVAGFSMGLGAFAAGILLAETEFRREIEVTIEPFKGLLLGLFFVSIGAGLDIGLVTRDPVPPILYAASLILIKAALAFLVALVFRLSVPVASEASLLLATGGEFAFVLLTAAISGGVLPKEPGAQAMLVVTLSMFAVPLLGRLGQVFAPGRPAETEFPHLAPESEVAAGRVLIVGYGRVGTLVAEMLRRHGISFVAVDNSAALVAQKRDAGVEIYWGNAARREFLLRCGVAHARALIVTVENPRVAEEVVRLSRAERADMPIVARARDARHATNLYHLGVSDAIPETIEASLQLAESVLVDLGVPMGLAIASIHEKRDEFRKLLQPPEDEARRKYALRALERTLEIRKRLAGQAPSEPGDETSDI